MESSFNDPGTSSSDAPRPKAGVDIGRCLSDAMEIYTKNFLVLVVASFLFMVLSVFSLFILAGPLLGGVCLMTLEAMRQEDGKIDLGRLFAGFDRFGSLLLLFFVVAIGIAIGTLMLIIPGLVLMTLWLFPFYLVVDKQVGLWDALGMSYEIVLRRGFWPNLLLTLLILAISFGPDLIPVVGTVVGIMVMPIAWLMSTSAYIQEVYEDDHASQPHSEPAKCGACGYAVRGLTTFTCPECGADLREVGMIPSQV